MAEQHWLAAAVGTILGGAELTATFDGVLAKLGGEQ